jgi:hypothetical protein
MGARRCKARVHPARKLRFSHVGIASHIDFNFRF